jgi:type II restriction/modification system DNA methylase subunit YeeA
MNVQDFINKWRRVELTERSASQQHFLDLCEVFEHPKPAEADASGEWFTFERGALKQGGGRGWADVWKRGYFGWEYKGKHRNLSAAYDQLLRYRESLENPPLLVTCDMERVVVHTNFTATVNRTHEVRLEEVAEPHNLEVLRALFHSPERLRPEATVAGVTRDVAERLGGLAKGLRGRGFEPTDVARFLDRIVFCLFAEDVGLLPEGLFTQVAERSRTPESFSRNVALLFDAMREGGEFFFEPIRHFNGSLFTESPVLPLTSEEIETVKAAARLDWGVVDPSIFGTLFERGLDPDTRAQLGAQYTSREDIETLIEPVVMRPLRREWEEARAEIEGLLAKDTAQSHRRAQVRLRAFHERLSGVRVLDPACGSGNFLYVALQRLKDLEKQALVYGADRGLGSLLPQVNPTQFYGIEVNPYAFDLAQTTLWIGYLQWIHHNGYGTPPEPILRPMTSFENKDAVLDLSDPSGPREPEWPAVDFIVGNPPFLGGSRIWEELGRDYQQKLWEIYGDRVPGAADLVCYWFEKASKHIEEGKAKRAGLLATQGIRGGANREVLKRIKESGDIFFAVSDRDWILDGANVHISMVGFDDGSEAGKMLDGKDVPTINANLSATADTTQARRLKENLNISFTGTKKSGDFNIKEEKSRGWLLSPNPHGKSNSDILRPWLNGGAIAQRPEPQWIIDTGTRMTEEEFSLYEAPHLHALTYVKPERDKNKRAVRRERWWLHAETAPAMRSALSNLSRYIATPRVSKHRLFIWVPEVVLCDDGVYIFARSDDYFFGVIHSRLHEVWSRAQGTQVRERESGFRYTASSCFETFPFPKPSDEQREAIAEAARELDALRSRWLDPPEWTRREVLEFPGSAVGPWARYVTDADSSGGVGVVRYPRPVPRDATAARELSRRTLTNLYNQRPGWLEHAHRRLDEAVSAAYGWPHALTDEEILARLLSLNLERAEQ